MILGSHEHPDIADTKCFIPLRLYFNVIRIITIRDHFDLPVHYTAEIPGHMRPDDPDIGTLRRIQMGRTTLVETVETWEPNFTLSYAIGGLPSLIRSVTNTWRLEPGDEGTNVTIISDVDAGPHLPQKVIARLFGRRFGSTSDEMLAGLAARVTAAGQRQ